MATRTGFSGVGDERRDLLGGLGAEPGHAAGEGVIPAWLVGEIVRAEPFHAVHQLDGFLFAAFFEEGRHFAERFAEELRGETGEFRASVGVVWIDADDRTQNREGAVFFAATDGVPVIAVEWVAFANLAPVESFDGEDVLTVERKTGGQAALAAEGVPTFGFRKTQQGAKAE